METLNLILGIASSIVSIVAVVMSINNSNKIKKINGNISSGNDSVNTIGDRNNISR